ncbi:MAG: methyl-accepting chemotaxis protein [Proteobacteria bacterium]|nr:methyl-accepting chemotaxis protein [Pseudomonadota bacterium]
MSTVGIGTAGRGTTFWMALSGVSLAIFGLNYLASTYTADRETWARGLVAGIQVKSQQLAKEGSDAIGGNQDAFKQFQATRDSIDNDVKALTTGKGIYSGYAGSQGVGGSLDTLSKTWDSVSQNADLVIRNQQQVQDISSNADKFTAAVPNLQARLDEVARAMSDGGAQAQQLFMAMRQVNLVNKIAAELGQVRAGGAGAANAVDALGRDSGMFNAVLKGFQDGDSTLGIQKLNSAGAVASLNQVVRLNADAQSSIGAFLKSAKQFSAVQDAQKQISDGSNTLLSNAQDLYSAFNNISLRRFFPNTYWAIAAGLGAIIGLLGLALKLYRDQAARFRKSQEDSQRNQEAIMRLLNETGSLAEGDLTVRATVTEDITGAIADSINLAVEELRSLVTTINETAVQVAAASQETQATAMHLADAAEHQAQQINTASDKISEMAASIDEVSKNSAESAEVAQRSVQIAAKGADVVRQTIQGMDSIRDQIQETSKRIKRLGESSQEIGSIVELINDISEQTNILALNAAIQAASAGEAGRGFAVVADEVQRLAERASNATKRIETLVQTIQSDTNEAVNSMEQTTAEVVSGARLAEDAGLALGEIETVSNDLASLISNISTAARQQSDAASDITATMNTIQEITSQTSQGASQTAESIGNLAQLAANLRRSVADFKLPG